MKFSIMDYFSKRDQIRSSLTYYILLVKDQSSFYEIRRLAISINIEEFNRVDGIKLNILKIFLEYLEFYIVAY